MDVYGIKLVGFTAENGRKLLLTLLFIVAVLLLRWALRALARLILQGRENERLRFWLQQGSNLTTAALMILGVLSIWFDDPTRLTTAVGLVTAGLAFALQKVVTSIAGYFVILRSRVFTVGDRILMSSVRGDVIALGFIQTTIMEMGQSPGERPDDPKVWVKSRQFTGRIVTVTNDKIFDEPVFNYTRDFPYLWEEITLPIAYKDDRNRAEQILLEATERHAVKVSEISQDSLQRMRERYYVNIGNLQPKTYFRLTENWLEITVRFLVREHGSREIKDAISREILTAFEQAGISIATTTFGIVALPPLRLERGSPIKT